RARVQSGPFHREELESGVIDLAIEFYDNDRTASDPALLDTKPRPAAHGISTRMQSMVRASDRNGSTLLKTQSDPQVHRATRESPGPPAHHLRESREDSPL